MAMAENGGGKVTTVEPNLNLNLVRQLQNIFPPDWFQIINFVESTSADYYSKLDEDETFDLVYIDGDHTYEGTKLDWENTKDRFNKFLLFDDYHLPSKEDPNAIQCAHLIDQIEDESKQLIIMDRRIFLDDRGLTDDEIDYGQVLLSKV